MLIIWPTAATVLFSHLLHTGCTEIHTPSAELTYSEKNNFDSVHICHLIQFIIIFFNSEVMLPFVIVRLACSMEQRWGETFVSV